MVIVLVQRVGRKLRERKVDKLPRSIIIILSLFHLNIYLSYLLCTWLLVLELLKMTSLLSPATCVVKDSEKERTILSSVVFFSSVLLKPGSCSWYNQLSSLSSPSVSPSSSFSLKFLFVPFSLPLWNHKLKMNSLSGKETKQVVALTKGREAEEEKIFLDEDGRKGE